MSGREDDKIASRMENLNLPRHEFTADAPSQVSFPQTREYQVQASKAEISNQRTLGQGQEIRTPNSNEYSDVLRHVYKEELCSGNINQDYKLVIISVHAVFLESGFICLDPLAEKKFPVGRGSKSTVNFQYTMPRLLVGAGDEVVETVSFKFQTLGKFVYVHGCLSRNVPVGFIRLDVSQFVPPVSSICTSIYGYSNSYNEREVFELWKIVKDGLVSPLLTDLCVKTGLDSPPCFTSILTDLKLNILEFLPGIDLATVGCVSSELRYISSKNDLWKQKCKEEFALDSEDVSASQWKDKYVTARERSKQEKRFKEIWTCGGGGFWRRGPAPGYDGVLSVPRPCSLPACVLRVSNT